jgi:hypothetical protein
MCVPAALQADFAVQDKQLDFSHLRDHLRRIAGGPGQLFSLGTDNAMLQLVSRGGLRVLVSQVRAGSSGNAVHIEHICRGQGCSS